MKGQPRPARKEGREMGLATQGSHISRSGKGRESMSSRKGRGGFFSTASPFLNQKLAMPDGRLPGFQLVGQFQRGVLALAHADRVEGGLQALLRPQGGVGAAHGQEEVRVTPLDPLGHP